MRDTETDPHEAPDEAILSTGVQVKLWPEHGPQSMGHDKGIYWMWQEQKEHRKRHSRECRSCGWHHSLEARGWVETDTGKIRRIDRREGAKP